jgi:hypothetical protein
MTDYSHFKAAEFMPLVELGTGRMQELISPESNFHNECKKMTSLKTMTKNREEQYL